MTAHVFVDESKFRGFLLAAAVLQPEQLAGLRREIAGLRLPHQRRLHFTAESDGRRRAILAALTVAAGPCALVYDAPGRRVREARIAAMTRLVDEAAKAGAVRLVIERDEPAVAADVRVIRERAARAGCLDTLRYAHEPAGAEPLLAIPDAVAWCWAKGGEWRRLASGLVARSAEV